MSGDMCTELNKRVTILVTCHDHVTSRQLEVTDAEVVPMWWCWHDLTVLMC